MPSIDREQRETATGKRWIAGFPVSWTLPFDETCIMPTSSCKTGTPALLCWNFPVPTVRRKTFSPAPHFLQNDSMSRRAHDFLWDLVDLRGCRPAGYSLVRHLSPPEKILMSFYGTKFRKIPSTGLLCEEEHESSRHETFPKKNNSTVIFLYFFQNSCIYDKIYFIFCTISNIIFITL